jgi:hypothetical protein
MKNLMLYSVLAVALLLVTAIGFHRGHHLVQAAHHDGPPPEAGDEPGFERAECLEWVAETYRVGALTEELTLDPAQSEAELRACMAENVRHMAVPIPVSWCDNIFKIHCSGLDVLVELGEGLADRCESDLADSLDPEREEHGKLRACLRDKVYELYAQHGEVTDREACRTLLVQCAAGSE